MMMMWTSDMITTELTLEMDGWDNEYRVVVVYQYS